MVARRPGLRMCAALLFVNVFFDALVAPSCAAFNRLGKSPVAESLRSGAAALGEQAGKGLEAVKSGKAAQAVVDQVKNSGSTSETAKFLTSEAALLGIASLPNTQCVVCQYVMGRLGQEIGFPEQINEANVYPRFEPNAALASSAAPTGYSPTSYGTKPGFDAPLPGPGFSYLQTASTEHVSEHSSQTAPSTSKDIISWNSFVEMGSRFINGVMEGLGIEVCRPGMHACRPRLRQPGRHSLERRIKVRL
eukprot:INCI5096.4.p1 GENE.INCI5096.4~~INCI5096.4.p1  ORF type:complete len:249 (+),score=34.72 INCI5096.4:154-900(+)